MPLLVELRLIEIVVLAMKIGAGILAVAIEEQLIELIRQVIVMRHVAPRSGVRVVLMQAAQQPIGSVQPSRQHPVRHRLDIELQQIDQIVEAALFEGQGSVDKSLRQVEPRPED